MNNSDTLSSSQVSVVISVFGTAQIEPGSAHKLKYDTVLLTPVCKYNKTNGGNCG